MGQFWFNALIHGKRVKRPVPYFSGLSLNSQRK